MALYQEISDVDLFANYKIEKYVSCNGRYRVKVTTLVSETVGEVELVLGRWKVLGGDSSEFRDLIDAIKRVVTTYQKCDKEYQELMTKFS